MSALLKHPLVDCDLEEAALWYCRHDPRIAERLIEDCRVAMLAAAANPFQFSIHFANVRRVRLRGFPHSIYFFVEADAVMILAIVHGRSGRGACHRRQTKPGTKKRLRMHL